MMNIKMFSKPWSWIISAVLFSQQVNAQETMNPEKLWEVKRVSALGVNKTGTHVIYKVTTPNIQNNGFDSKVYQVSIQDGNKQLIENYQGLIHDKNLSPDGTKKLFHQAVQLSHVLGTDLHKSLPAANAYVFDDLDYRHWDTWNDGSYNHVFYQNLSSEEKVDIMPNEPFYTPQSPFGTDEDYIWGPKGEHIYYVSKKVKGTEYVTSTNSDIYQYNLANKTTKNITAENKGYDTSPAFSNSGQMAWLQMRTPGYETDKNDIMVMHRDQPVNLTAHWDGSVRSFLWSHNSRRIYFTAPTKGTIQIFSVDLTGDSKRMPAINQITEGQFDVNGIVAHVGEHLIVTRNSMNAAKEIYRLDLNNNKLTALTSVNDQMFAELDKPTVKKRIVTTKDGHDMLVWVIYPPGFDENKKYPTLLYAQGGPQSPLSQFYSYRWNFQLMASQGYIVVAPNRRGMPGHGVEWNKAISKDWGGGAIQDYLDAIDDVAKESYVDNDRLGAIGASFGGYSVFYLAGHHEKRFKTFIAHDGIFDFRSMYGTTEELFFVNHDIGGSYWDKSNAAARKSYDQFNPSNFVGQWDTPMLVIHGGKDYRVPIGQGVQAFQAAKLKGLKSRFF